MASSSASGSKSAELEEELKGLKEQKAAELKRKQGTRDLELLGELNKDLDRVQAEVTALYSGSSTESGAGVEPGSAELKAFWQALATVEFDGDLLELPEGVHFLGLEECGSRLMLRDVHGQLMDIAEDLFAVGCKRLVVRGTPGIGKSWWLFLLMREAARRGVTVVLQHFRLGERFLFSGDSVLVGQLKYGFRAELAKPATWYLVDGMAPKDVAARTFVAVSPDRKHYSEYLKAGGGRLKGNVAVRYMPVWSSDELLRARELVFPQVPEKLVKESHAKWGGVPRYCLHYAQDEERQKDLARALDLHNLTLLVKAVGSLETTEAVSHKIVHWAVTPDLKKEIVVFASKYIAREVMHRLRKHARLDLANKLSVCMDIREMAYFPVPENRFSEFRKQKIVTERGTVVQRKSKRVKKAQSAAIRPEGGNAPARGCSRTCAAQLLVRL